MHSSAPAATAALHAHFRQVADDNPDLNLQVPDADPVNYVANQYLVLVGPGPVVQEPAALGNLRRLETYPIECVARSWHGNIDQQGRRDDVFTMLDAVSDLITADPTAGGAIAFWQLGDYTLTQGIPEDGNGWVCELAFNVKVTTHLERNS